MTVENFINLRDRFYFRRIYFNMRTSVICIGEISTSGTGFFDTNPIESNAKYTPLPSSTFPLLISRNYRGRLKNLIIEIIDTFFLKKSMQNSCQLFHFHTEYIMNFRGQVLQNKLDDQFSK